MYVDRGYGPIEMMQLDIHTAGHVDAELKRLIRRRGHLELVIGH